MSAILFFLEDVEYTITNRESRINWISSAIASEGENPGDINVILCSDEYLLKMNQEYLDHNYYTDIITFDNSVNQNEISGDLFISIDRVRDNAAQIDIPEKDELDRVIIHGILHLLGFNDKTEAEISLMREKEEAYLSLRRY